MDVPEFNPYNWGKCPQAGQPIEKFETPYNWQEWHSVVSIKFGQLVESGFFKWRDKSWTWDYYNEAQYERMCNKIIARFYDREIAITPPGQWKREYLRIMNEIMPKYKALYKALEDGLSPMYDSDKWGKKRDVFSDFPATMLSGDNQDYASNSNENEYEDIGIGNFIETADALANVYNDVDVYILNDLEQLFSCLMTVNLNAL